MAHACIFFFCVNACILIVRIAQSTNIIYRSKLKHTEMECKYLKRCFGSLKEQNRLLQKEVEELRALNAMPASILTMCPRCERATDATDNAVKEGTATRSQSRRTISSSSSLCWLVRSKVKYWNVYLEWRVKIWWLIRRILCIVLKLFITSMRRKKNLFIPRFIGFLCFSNFTYGFVSP